MVAECCVQDRVLVYERALQAMPGCFKVWRDYLDFRRSKASACMHLCGRLCVCVWWSKALPLGMAM